MKRSWSWVSFLVGLAVAGILVGGPFIYYVAQQQEQDAYEACLSAQGYDLDDPGVVTSDQDLDDLIDASGNC